MKVLKERHAIEEEEERLRRRKEMLGLEAELAAAKAQMEVCNANQENHSVAHSSGRITNDKSLV